jgi:hypothetical protein
MKILILGVPKTGTTYLYYMLKNVMPAHTACFFEPKSLADVTTDTRQDFSLTKFLVTSAAFNELLRPEALDNYDKVVLLIRDPRDLLVSTFMYSIYDMYILQDLALFGQFMTLLKVKEKKPRSLSMKKLLEIQAQINDSGPTETLEFVKAGLGMSSMLVDRFDKLFTIKYEDLVDGRLEDLERYLGMPLSDRDPHIALEHQLVARSKSYGDWRNWYLQEDVECFEKSFTWYINEFQYPTDWDLASPSVLDPERLSRYAMRLAWARGDLDSIRFLWESFPDDEDFLWRFLGGNDVYLPYIRATEESAALPLGAVIMDPHIENQQGQMVNILKREESYYFAYRVRMLRDERNVGFWMGLGSRKKGTILGNGTQMHGLEQAETVAGQVFSLKFPFTCGGLEPDIYFLDAGVTTHRNLFEMEYLHRRLKCVVFAIIQKKLRESWLVKPEITEYQSE